MIFIPLLRYKTEIRNYLKDSYLKPTIQSYQMICFVFWREVVELHNVRKIRFDDVRWRHTSGLEGQVIVVRVNESDGTEDGLDFNAMRR